MIDYNQFREEYKANLGDKKFSMKEFNQAWNEYKNSQKESKDVEIKQEVEVKEVSNDNEIIRNMDSITNDLNTINEDQSITTEEITPDQNMGSVDLKGVCGVLHSSANLVIKNVTENNVSLSNEEQENLNQSLAIILEKTSFADKIEKHGTPVLYLFGWIPAILRFVKYKFEKDDVEETPKLVKTKLNQSEVPMSGA